MAKRFVVEGEWSGHTSSQQRVVHRRVKAKWYAEKAAKISAIGYTDGTTLNISVRPAKPRERVQEIRGYDSLMDRAVDAGKEGYVSVMEL